MTVENQVCTLDQAKRLNELGIDQLTSEYSFVGVESDIVLWNRGMFNMWVDEWGDCVHVDKLENYSAFTSGELGQALGEGFHSFISGEDWCCRGKRPLICYGPTEAQARAKMLIECLESGKMTADEVNERLSS